MLATRPPEATMRLCLLFTAILFLCPPCPSAPPKAPPEPVELAGKARDFQFIRDWSHYYWREDFTFLLTDEKTGKTWRIISREPTPAYHFRMGTTRSEERRVGKEGRHGWAA